MRDRDTVWQRQAAVISIALAAVLFLLPLTVAGTTGRLRGTAKEEAEAVPSEDAGAETGTADIAEEGASGEDSPETGTGSGTEAGSGDAGTDGAGETGGASAATAQVEKPYIPPEQRDEAVTLRVLDNGAVRTMTMSDYLAGVLRGEMPASFEEEALKAQAVAARTYTRRMTALGSKHGKTADICTDYRCCQAFKSERQARAEWGGQADALEAKIRAAVDGTDGELLLYDDAPILAVFHSSSPGVTEDVEHVWGSALPYLVPVTSPEIGTAIPNYYSRAEYKAETVRKKVQAVYPEADFSGPVETWLSNEVRNAAGTVESLSVGGVTMRGAKLRTILELRSACYVWEVEKDGGETKIIFYVTGYGHGVGLSQYGANQMAKDGANYQEILTHYYTGVTLGPYAPNP